VDDDELPPFVQQIDRPHRGATRRSPVAGLDIDMHRPETLRAVVRVTVADDRVATVGATEILASAREAPRQEAPRFFESNGARSKRDPRCGIAVEGARASDRRSQNLRTPRYRSE
jgi:hypothetical protein